jgi:hypothetical protein
MTTSEESVAFTCPQVDAIQISDAIRNSKRGIRSNLIRTTRAIGIRLGD